MVLGTKKLLELVKKFKLVENLSERELTNPEGAGFDLRLGKVHRVFGDTFLGIEERKTVEAKTVMEYNPQKSQVYTIKPDEQILVTTLEKLNLPENITANFLLRGTLLRSGIIVSGGNSAPGYHGEITFSLFNCGKCPVKIELGARIVHMQFYEIKGEASNYRGQWQGGRVTATEKEKQV